MGSSPETSLVTITAGGNDVGFLPRLTQASLPWPLPVLPPVKARVESLGQTRATDQRFEQLERNLTVIAARLAAATQAAAGTAGWTYVAASAVSADHHAWSAEPWARRFHLSLRGGAPYHPNAAGMAAVARLVVAALRPGTSTDPEVH
jgi:lysophospholipase L1-like esterase